MDQLVCFWKFGPQCPTSPLLPPPLEDFDGYRTSANTHPHKQHLYGLLDSTMHTSRNCVTNYIHKFNVIVLGRELCWKDVLAAGCPVVGREILAPGFPNDWLDQTMSYQLIQTTSFAMHPRLVDYITVALVWMNLPAGS
ncbi:pentatricopeptide repeat-containing protein mitochondrial [Dorcoceras hygrometricum]|uniref:Pentatricopeptide repeat-containing protein mitochondrial n=1 Tax=Dorcoceras hygrometricum TaxID=472368 RepID=A0A2Z7ADX2_9LAMI|nr:pentatricopeptide repeat-containing protein mitochondrial [Dorcoceras hygrometricum]